MASRSAIKKFRIIEFSPGYFKVERLRFFCMWQEMKDMDRPFVNVIHGWPQLDCKPKIFSSEKEARAWIKEVIKKESFKRKIITP